MGEVTIRRSSLTFYGTLAEYRCDVVDGPVIRVPSEAGPGFDEYPVDSCVVTGDLAGEFPGELLMLSSAWDLMDACVRYATENGFGDLTVPELLTVLPPGHWLRRCEYVDGVRVQRLRELVDVDLRWQLAQVRQGLARLGPR